MNLLRYALSTTLLIRSSSAFVSRAATTFSSTAAASFATTQRCLFNKLFSSTNAKKYPILADESVMSPKKHGTSEQAVQKNLRWNCDYETADRICNFNRHYAEFSGYWTSTDFLKSIQKSKSTAPVDFYDSVTGERLFTAPVGRTMEEFLRESQEHGWPSFRDEETNWDRVRVLKDGECVSTTGTHLGHNLPDRTGNRYCINLVSVAGRPRGGKQ